jgi:hypothetical protein
MLDVAGHAKVNLEVPMSDGDDVTQRVLPVSAARVLRYAVFTSRAAAVIPPECSWTPRTSMTASGLP